ncbi:MAG: hypothetical protein KDA53_06990 [Hyphomonas sp.]|nr:hypothetical protein [Hyphomonas sp.]
MLLTQRMLGKLASAAVAAAITASITYGQYAVASGPNGSGLMPPPEVFAPNMTVDPDADPFAQLMQAFAELKQEKARSQRHRAVIDWLITLQQEGLAGFSVDRLEGGVLYDIEFNRPRGDNATARVLIAMPQGATMPYAIRMATIEGEGLRLEAVSCTGNATLAELGGDDAMPAAEAASVIAVSDYLAAPAPADLSLPADCLTRALMTR